MPLPPDTELTLIAFPDGHGEWLAFIHEFDGLGLKPTGIGNTAENARRDLYQRVKTIQPGLDDIDRLKVSLRAAIRHTVLIAKLSTQRETVTLGEIYRRSGR